MEIYHVLCPRVFILTHTTTTTTKIIFRYIFIKLFNVETLL